MMPHKQEAAFLAALERVALFSREIGAQSASGRLIEVDRFTHGGVGLCEGLLEAKRRCHWLYLRHAKTRPPAIKKTVKARLLDAAGIDKAQDRKRAVLGRPLSVPDATPEVRGMQ